jgi:hypothetical protein
MSEVTVPSVVAVPNAAPTTWTSLILLKGRLVVVPGEDFGLSGRIHLYDPATKTIGPQVTVLDVKINDLKTEYPAGLGALAGMFLAGVGGLMQREQLKAMITASEEGEEKEALLAGLTNLEAKLRGE